MLPPILRNAGVVGVQEKEAGRRDRDRWGQEDIHPPHPLTNMPRAMVGLKHVCKLFSAFPVGKWGLCLFPSSWAPLSEPTESRVSPGEQRPSGFLLAVLGHLLWGKPHLIRRLTTVRLP